MAKRVAPNREIGGLFLIEDSPTNPHIICRIEGVPFDSMNGDSEYWETRWANDLGPAWMRRDFWHSVPNTDFHFPPQNSTSVFDFKGKTYVKLGLDEGLMKIRNIENIDGDSRDAPLVFPTGEEDDESDS